MDIQEYNIQIISEFLSDKQGITPFNTYRSIRSDCKAIQNYLTDKNMLFPLLTAAPGAEQYVQFLTEHFAAATVKRRLCTLRSIVYWCKEKGYISQDSSEAISDDMNIPPPNYAPDTVIAKMLQYCSNISLSDEYILARSKLECLMVIICGYKVSELRKLLVSDMSSDLIRERLLITGLDRIRITDTFLHIREAFTNDRIIKSDILFVSKFGGFNNQIHADFERIRCRCNIDRSVTLSSIRNTCIRGYSSYLENDIVTAKVFDTSARWVNKMRKSALNEEDKERRNMANLEFDQYDLDLLCDACDSYIEDMQNIAKTGETCGIGILERAELLRERLMAASRNIIK